MVAASPRSSPAKAPLHTRILVGFAAGSVLGLLANSLGTEPVAGSPGLVQPSAWVMFSVTQVAEPVGRIFLRLLLMTVVPMVVSSLTLGVAGLGDARRLGRLGLKTLLLTLLVSGISVATGVFLANAVEPGLRVPREVREELFAANREKAVSAVQGAVQTKDKTFAQSIVEIVPDNPLASASRSPPDMLALMLFSVLLGVALALAGEKGKALSELLEAVFEVMQRLISLVMTVAPIGVSALLYAMTARFGLGVLKGLAAFALTVLAGLLFHQVVVYSALLRFAGKVSPLEFFRRVRTVMTTAFATSSSNATLPTALRCADERLHIPREIASFVLTVGATANQNGTALYEGVTVLFLAQLFGVPITLSQQVMVMGLAILAGVGTAGVPSGSIPFIILVLQSVGVPAEGIAVILGIDRLLDMCRTVPNVTGDLVLATVVARSEGADIMRPEAIAPLPLEGQEG